MFEWKKLDSKTWTVGSPKDLDIFISEVKDKATGKLFYEVVQLARTDDGEPTRYRSKRLESLEEAMKYCETL